MLKRILVLFFIIFLFPFNLYADTRANIISSDPQINADTSDAGLTSAINLALSKNVSAQGLMVGIQVRNRVAYLSGTLQSTGQAALIIALVNSVPGVLDVNTDQLNLTGNQTLPNDLILTSKVKGALIREQAFNRTVTLDSLPITVETNYGIVYLKGSVDSQAQLIYIVKIAQLVPGVPRVISELSVKPIPVHN